MKSLGNLGERLSSLRALLGAETTAFRWVDAPEVTVDSFDRVAVLSVYRAFSEAEERALARAVVEAGASAVYLKRRPREARKVANEGADWVAPVVPLEGAPVDAVEVLEGGLRFEIRPANGLSTGLYLDARDARQWVREHAEGKTVLNLFSYTCGFGVAALAGGATRALNVDASRKVLDWGKKNCELNGFAVETRDFISGDAFDWLGRFAKKGETFDVVVLDPPGFSTAGESRFTAARDYHRLVEAASAVLAEGGELLAMCNVEQLSAGDFERLIARGFGGRRFAITERFGASEIDFAQPGALKCVALRLA